MESDQANYITNQIHGDDPLKYPAVIYIQDLLCKIDPALDSEDIPFDRFITLIITEFQIIKSIFWSYESEIFYRLISVIEDFLCDYGFNLSEQPKDTLQECISLLRFLSECQENLDRFPSGYEEVDPREMVVRANIMRQVQNKFDNPNINCPSCSNRFSQLAFDVTRSLYAVKCPKCNQSISV